MVCNHSIELRPTVRAVRRQSGSCGAYSTVSIGDGMFRSSPSSTSSLDSGVGSFDMSYLRGLVDGASQNPWADLA